MLDISRVSFHRRGCLVFIFPPFKILFSIFKIRNNWDFIRFKLGKGQGFVIRSSTYIIGNPRVIQVPSHNMMTTVIRYIREKDRGAGQHEERAFALPGDTVELCGLVSFSGAT